MKLWQKGLLTILIGGLINAALIKYEIAGVIRELMRLVILAGFGVLVFGLIKRNK